MMVLAVVFLVCLIMLLFVVPVFAKTFKDAGAAAARADPDLWSMLRKFMQSYWWLVIGVDRWRHRRI
jgi:type IV pilus assembly protein PilC